jgi:cyclophilin family peptidyl-prolyl cis-trans isomerase
MAERRARQRRRRLAVGAAAVVGTVALAIAFVAFVAGGREPSPRASATPSATAGPTGPTGSERPGKRTGTVEPSPGPTQVACGAQVPKAADRPKPRFAAPAQVIEQGKTYTATLRTSCGDIVIELLADRAPQTVNSFVFLARKGFFDGTRIHRIDTGLDVLQGGDPTGTGTGGPGYTIPDELTGGETYGPGTVAMANAGPGTGGSQFFIVVGNGGHRLDATPNYTVFGRVIRGLDVARRIEAIPVQDPQGGIAGQQPAQAVYIEEVVIRAR